MMIGLTDQSDYSICHFMVQHVFNSINAPLGQVGPFYEIYQRHKEPNTYHECQWKRNTKMVD